MSDLASMLHPMDLAWLRWVAGATMSTGVLLTAAFALDLLLRRRVAARWRVLLPAVVLLRLALPLSWTSPLGVIGLRATEPAQGVIAQAPPVDVATSVVATPVSAPTRPPASAPPIAPALHVGVALALLGAALASRFRASAALRDARPARESVKALASGVAVVEHDALGPAVVGVLRPRIVLPTPLVDALAEEEVASVMRHEIAHVRRRDPIVRALVQVATFAAWPIVPAWLAASWLRGLVEQACDERALEGGGAQARSVHARALVDVATWRPRPLRLALGLLPFGEGVRARVKALRFARRWATPMQAASVLVVAPMLVLTLGARAEVRDARGNAVASGSGLKRPIPPQVMVRVEVYRAPDFKANGIPLLDDGVLAGELLNATEAAALRERLVASGEDSEGAIPLTTPLGGRNAMQSHWGIAKGGGFQESLKLIVEPEYSGEEIELKLTTWELPEGHRLVVEADMMHAGDAIHLVRLRASDHGAFHQIVTLDNVTFAPGAPIRVESPRVSLDVFETPVGDALEAFTRVGATPELDDDVAARIVSVKFEALPWEEAVARLAEAAGADWRIRDGAVRLVMPEQRVADIPPTRATSAGDEAVFARIRSLVDGANLDTTRIVPEADRISVYGRARDRSTFAAGTKALFSEFVMVEVGVLQPEAAGSFEFFMRVEWPVDVVARMTVSRLDASAKDAAVVPWDYAPMADDPRITLLVPRDGTLGRPFEQRLDSLADAGRLRVVARPVAKVTSGRPASLRSSSPDGVMEISVAPSGPREALAGGLTLSLPWIPGDPLRVKLPAATSILRIAEPDGGVTLVGVELRADP